MNNDRKEPFLGAVDIAHILPCLADPEKIRFIAYLDRDVSEILPYLNSVLEGAIYNHQGRTLTLRKGGRLVSLHPRKIAGGKLDDLEDARRTVEWLKDLANHCRENRGTIEPNFERRRRLTALDVYKLLPAANCGRCGERTCLAFALRLTQEELGAERCPELFSGDHVQKRDELFRLLAASGYRVPEVFAPREEE